MPRTGASLRILCLLLSLTTVSPLTTAERNQPHRFADLETISDLFFVDDVHGWVAISGKQTVYSTADGGKTWSRNGTPTGLYSLTFIDSSIGWALGGTSSQEGNSIGVFKTIDGGHTWN